MTSVRAQKPSLLLKILLIVLLVLLVLGVGFSTLILPQMKKIQDDTLLLAEKQAQLHEMEAREAQHDSAEQDVHTAYREALAAVAPFFSDAQTEPQLEMVLASFLTANRVAVKSIVLSPRVVVELSSASVAEDVPYALGTLASSSASVEEASEQLAEPLQIPALTATVEYHQTAQSDVESFLDSVAEADKHIVLENSSIYTAEDGSMYGTLQLAFYLAAQPEVSAK